MSQSRRLVDALKRELKVRGMTYRALADGLGVAESTVKRSLASGRLDFDRLDAICDLMSLELEDLVRPPEGAASGLERLSRGEEETLIGDPKLLLVAYLVVNHWRFDEIVDRYDISEHECIRLVAELERMKLAELLPGNRIRALFSTDFSWRSDGPIERYFRSEVQAHFVASDFDADGALRLVRMGDVSPATLGQVVSRLEAAGRLFDDAAREDRRLPLDSKRGTLMVLAIRHWEFHVFKELERA